MKNGEPDPPGKAPQVGHPRWGEPFRLEGRISARTLERASRSERRRGCIYRGDGTTADWNLSGHKSCPDQLPRIQSSSSCSRSARCQRTDEIHRERFQ